MSFAQRDSTLNTFSLFTITYYRQKIPLRREKSEEVNKYPWNKSEEFFGCDRWDFSLPRPFVCRKASPRYARLASLALCGHRFG